MANGIPADIPNLIGGEWKAAQGGEWFDNLSPHDGSVLCRVARSRTEDVAEAVAAARAAQQGWADTPPVQRGLILNAIVTEMGRRQQEIGDIVAAETGKSPAEGAGETGGAMQCGLFFASEGQRLYGKTTTSGTPHKYASTIREPRGVAALIIAANTPIANVAWKVFPALVCGNTAVLKAAEDTPATAWVFAEIAKEVGLPPGVLNVVQGLGEEAGAPLVQHEDVDVISFTGSSAVGRFIQRNAADRMVRISLELGGKNALVVCDDADIDKAVEWSVASAFTNAGQRCASGSRLIVFESIYPEFKAALLARTKELSVGPTNDDYLGAVINERQLTNMVRAVEEARADGAEILTGGHRLTGPDHASGFYMAPTLITGVDPDAPISCEELFGPIAILYRVKDYAEALALTNRSPYGLTACIHTRSLHRAVDFSRRARTGVVVVNAGTYGSEPHMPFGGRGLSGNGSREPGTEALDVYSELKDIYVNIDPEMLS